MQNLAEQILRNELDVALVVGAEALATQKRFKAAGERYPYSFKPEEKRPFPWEAPFHPAEVAHEVFQAWLTFAIFDNARRAHLGVPLDEYRTQLGEQWERFTQVAAANPEAWFPIERSADGDHHRRARRTGWSATRTRSTWSRSWTSTWPARSC